MEKPTLKDYGYLRPNELAKYLSIRRQSVYRLVKRGVLPEPIKLGRAALWDVKEVRAAIEEYNKNRKKQAE